MNDFQWQLRWQILFCPGIIEEGWRRVVDDWLARPGDEKPAEILVVADAEGLGARVALPVLPVDAADVPVVAGAGAEDTSGGVLAGVKAGVVPPVALWAAKG